MSIHADIREFHVNSNEGGWAGLRNFLCPFHGVQKKYLASYVAIHEFVPLIISAYHPNSSPLSCLYIRSEQEP